MKLVDTNLLRAANGDASQAGLACQLECVNRLAAIMAETEGPLLLDSLGDILEEYRKNASHTGQPGVGDQFLQWALINQGNPQRCPYVVLNRDAERRYREYPTEAALQDFDPSDRMFVAAALTVATTGEPMPVIWVATDSDWAHPPHYAAFSALGLRIEFVCPDYLTAPA